MARSTRTTAVLQVVGMGLVATALVISLFSGVEEAWAAVKQGYALTHLSEYVSWLLPPIAVLIAIAFYVAFSVSAIGSIGLRKQLSQRIKAEEKLKLLSGAVEQSSEGMAVSDLDGKLVFVNRAFAAMHDYTPDELRGKELKILHTPEQFRAVQDANRLLVECGVYAGEVWHLRRNGSSFPAFMHNSVLRADDGRPMGMIATMRDISEQKEAEAKLKEYSEKLEHMVEERTKELDSVRAGLFVSAKLAAMGRMGAGIAHQLNSPLCGGLLMVDSLMEDAGDDPERLRKLATLRKSMEGMRDVIECMLSLAMVGRLGKPTEADANINDILQKIIGFVSLETQQRKIEVKASYDSSIPKIKARVGELDQVFLNIINNAIDAMADGGRLGVKTIYNEGTIFIDISDTGKGIAPEYFSRLFEPFFTTSQGKKGLGLGLSIAREIIERYGGGIAVESELRKGSKFSITLPDTNQ